MNRVYIIYESDTGHTEIMAKTIAEGVTEAGGEATLLRGQKATRKDILDADVLALGSPAMYTEDLHITMKALMEDIKDCLTGKPVVLFGSYDWSNGIWINNWHELVKNLGAEMIQDKQELRSHLKPDKEDLERCREVGKKLASYEIKK